MGYDPNRCNQLLIGQGMIPCGGGVQNPHCVDFNNTPEHAALCPDPNTDDVYKPVPTIECYSPVLNQSYFTSINKIATDCAAKMAAEPQNKWTFRQCDCCCSCFAYGTPIATPEGLRAVETFAKGDLVLVVTAVAGGKLTWGTDQIAFSSGTGPNNRQGGMVHLRYGGDRFLIATIDQVLMVDGGKLVQAGRLIPGTDRLLLADGSTIEIDEARLGTFADGVHHIATGTRWNDTMDGHLLSAGGVGEAPGVVAGDYLLQLHLSDLPADELVPGHWDRPIIGSIEYQQAHEHLVTSLFHAMAPHATVENAAESFVTGFRPYLGRTQQIPDDAGAFFTEAQEADIISNPDAVKLHLTDTINNGLTARLIKQINAFYPDVFFYIAWDDIHINAYAFWQYGRRFVYVSGGLLRLAALGIEGIAIALLGSVGYFYGAGDEQGTTLATKARADYWGVGTGSRTIYMPSTWFATVFKGITQVQTVFSYVSPENASGDGTDGSDPSLSCRYETFMASITGATLPACAGGTTAPPLALESATPQNGGLLVIFNEPASVVAAETVANYTLAPKAAVTKATLNGKNAREVQLEVTLAAETRYTITAANLTSVDGAPLDPARASLPFATSSASVPA